MKWKRLKTNRKTWKRATYINCFCECLHAYISSIHIHHSCFFFARIIHQFMQNMYTYHAVSSKTAALRSTVCEHQGSRKLSAEPTSPSTLSADLPRCAGGTVLGRRPSPFTQRADCTCSVHAGIWAVNVDRPRVRRRRFLPPSRAPIGPSLGAVAESTDPCARGSVWAVSLSAVSGSSRFAGRRVTSAQRLLRVCVAWLPCARARRSALN